MAIKYLSGNRTFGTAAERPSIGGVTGWVELGRTTLSSTSDNIDVTGLNTSNYPYIMVLGHQFGADTHVRYRFNSDSGSNYARRYSANGGSDETNTSIDNYPTNYDMNPCFNILNITNKADQEKLITGGTCELNQQTGAGNAPHRMELVGKWANTSDSISSVNCYQTGSGNFAVGSEVVVLGANPSGGGSTTAWQELDSDSGTTPLCSFTAKKYLWVQAHVKGSDSGKFQFGNNSLDSGSNYGIRYQSGGASDDTNTSASGSEPLTITTPIYFNMFIINKSDQEKLIISHGARQNTAGSGNAPNRWEEVFKWANTSAQINRVGYVAHNGTLDSSCQIKVWGMD